MVDTVVVATVKVILFKKKFFVKSDACVNTEYRYLVAMYRSSNLVVHVHTYMCTTYMNVVHISYMKLHIHTYIRLAERSDM